LVKNQTKIKECTTVKCKDIRNMFKQITDDNDDNESDDNESVVMVD